MSKIPYQFVTPVPKYFIRNGWLKDHKAWIFLSWCFSRISFDERVVFHDSQLVKLHPFEFIFGRFLASSETGLTEKEVRNVLKKLLTHKVLFLRASAFQYHYSVYTISKEVFCDDVDDTKGQRWASDTASERASAVLILNDGKNSCSDIVVNEDEKTDSKQVLPQKGQRRGQRKGHNQDSLDSLDDSINHSNSLSFSEVPKLTLIDLIDPLLSPTENSVQLPCGVTLSQSDFQECLLFHGTKAVVEQCIHEIAAWPGRKHPIKDWVGTICRWKGKNHLKHREQANREVAAKLETIFAKSEWRCEIHKDHSRDAEGLLFFNGSGRGDGEELFFTFTDSDFRKKVVKTLNRKGMMLPGA